jgi:hypothetical protein
MTKPMKAKIKKTVLYGLLFMASKWTIIGILYFSGFWSYWFLMLFPIADTIAATFAIIYLRSNYRKYFKQVLENHHPDTYKSLIEAIELKNNGLAESTKFALKSKNPLDKRLPFSAYFLAMIQVLEEENLSFEKIREYCLEVASAYVAPKNRIHKWYNLLLPKLINSPIAKPLISKMKRKVAVLDSPNGFRAQVLTNKTETLGFGYGIDILECGICKVFKANEAQKYSSLLCEVDKLTSSFAGLELVRTGTIANGHSNCDFRFKAIQ